MPIGVPRRLIRIRPRVHCGLLESLKKKRLAELTVNENLNNFKTARAALQAF